MLTGPTAGAFPVGSNGSLFLTIFAVIFFIVMGLFLFLIIKSLMAWSTNNKTPVVDRTCKVVAKRMQLSGGSGDSSSSTSYYVTFEFEDRSRMELWIARQQFGYMVEGDKGTLTFQGTRFKEFDRNQAV